MMSKFGLERSSPTPAVWTFGSIVRSTNAGTPSAFNFSAMADAELRTSGFGLLPTHMRTSFAHPYKPCLDPVFHFACLSNASRRLANGPASGVFEGVVNIFAVRPLNFSIVATKSACCCGVKYRGALAASIASRSASACFAAVVASFLALLRASVSSLRFFKSLAVWPCTERVYFWNWATLPLSSSSFWAIKLGNSSTFTPNSPACLLASAADFSASPSFCSSNDVIASSSWETFISQYPSPATPIATNSHPSAPISVIHGAMLRRRILRCLHWSQAFLAPCTISGPSIITPIATSAVIITNRWKSWLREPSSCNLLAVSAADSPTGELAKARAK